MDYGESFLELAQLYKTTEIEFQHLKPITLAMWILESGRGKSGLAKDHLNFAGMKYRTELDELAKRISYQAHDGSHYYCEFANLSDFIKGFWLFLDRSPYDGWRDLVDDEEQFIHFIGPIWAEDSAYANKVLGLRSEASALLSQGFNTVSATADEVETSDEFEFLLSGSPGFSLSPDKKVLISNTSDWKIEYRGKDSCPYGRTATANKKKFDSIILHHNNPKKTLDWYVQYQLDGDPERGGHFGYHFYIAEDGFIVQGAPLTMRTNHLRHPSADVRTNAKFVNSFSNSSAIGISCPSAGVVSNGISVGSQPSVSQIAAVEFLILKLCDIYDIPFSNVFGHGEVQTNRHIKEGQPMAKTVRSWGGMMS